MARPYALLRSGFPYYMTLGMRRVTSNAVDIAFGKEDRIYILCRGGLGTDIRRINWADDNLGVIGGGTFQWPSGLLCDEDELLYVSDEAHNKVFVLDREGTLLNSWGEQGDGAGQFNRPSGIAFDDDGNIVLSDTLNHRIQTYSREGEFISQFGEFGDGKGQLNMPWGLTVDDEGDIYVADWRNDRVQKFAPDGEFLMEIGGPGDDKGEFDRPTSVAVDSDGDIYVCDWGNDRVQLFDSEGRFVEQFIGDANLSRSAREYILANPVTLRLREMADLEATKRFRAPLTVRTDDEGKLYVCDFGSHRIQIYKKEAYALNEQEIAPPLRNPVLFTT
ncbi:MAG: NHL repeat-containing protein [Chloroflexi bacterium]|nr:NHL repeat-containing protein [Chloroflexota bacterium]